MTRLESLSTGGKLMLRIFTVMLVLGMSISLAAVYTPAGADQMVASYYGDELAGNPTATGEPFDPAGYTAAHKTLPFGTMLDVCYQDCVTVRVNDRGPYVAGRDLDLSAAAADAIGLTPAGVGVVSVEILDESAEPEIQVLPDTGGIRQ